MNLIFLNFGFIKKLKMKKNRVKNDLRKEDNVDIDSKDTIID
jgi:hypothetical protein